jgi:hypothetical protein
VKKAFKHKLLVVFRTRHSVIIKLTVVEQFDQLWRDGQQTAWKQRLRDGHLISRRTRSMHGIVV